MKTTFDVEIKLAAREWLRQFYTAAVRSFAKTVTEPITNSDTSYKRKLSLPDASGLVEKALALKKGTKFDLSPIKAAMEGTAPAREIEIHLYTAKGYDRPSRTCEIVDLAEGLSIEELKAAFEEFAADKSGVSKGKPGRSLFGRGVSDVLLGHQEGAFFSYKDDILSRVQFSFDTTKDKAPKVQGTVIGKPSAAQLKDLHLRPKENGSCVRFLLNDDCRIPEDGTIVPYLTQFYMLRLINADPNVTVSLFRYRAYKKMSRESLDYDFPIGDVIERFSSTISDPVPRASLKPLAIDGIVCRADIKGDLPGKDAREQRANGLLIVDDKDAVLDLTLLPQFEGAPYLANIFGIIRITNLRAVIEWYLNNGKDSPLTTSRDGFDLKHEFTKTLFAELTKHLEPVYRREEERFKKSTSDSLSKEARQRIDDAIKELNKLLKDLLGEGEDGGEPSKLDPGKPLQFLPSTTKLIMGRRRVVRLYFKKELAKHSGGIIYDTSNAKITLKPLSQVVADGKTHDDYFVYDLTLECSSLHETATITALAEGREEMYEAELKISDVTTGGTIAIPEDIEFRPTESHGQPNRNNSIALFINSGTIPPGRRIRIEIEKSRGPVMLLEGEKAVSALSVTFGKSQIIPGTSVGRIAIPWRGTGWGQWATIRATTKKPDGTLVEAGARIVLEEPEDAGGMIKEIRYENLGNDKCSDLVDGIIWINSNHFLNRVVFGPTQKEYGQKIEDDATAQYRFAALVVEQSVYRLAEESHRENKLVLATAAPVTSLREFIDTHTHKFAPRIVKHFMTKKLA